MPGVEGRTGRTDGDTGKRPSPARKTATPDRTTPLTAVDVMTRNVIMVRRETTVDELSELFQLNSVHSAPVVDDSEGLVGIISEADLVFGQMGFSDAELELMKNDKAMPVGEPRPPRRVGELMTSHPVAVEETATVREICRLIWRLKIHSVPVLSGSRVVGIVSSVDICRLIAEDKASLQREQ